MSLLWLDGFDTYGSSSGSAPSPSGILSRKYAIVNSESTFDIEDGRNTGKCLELVYSAYTRTPNLTTNSTIIIGASIKFKALNCGVFTTRESGTSGINLNMAEGDLIVLRGSTPLAKTTGLGLALDTWYYIEFKIFVNDTTGTYEARVNGDNVLSDTNVDTKTTGNAYYNQVELRYSNSSDMHQIDDFYVCDGSGSLNNDFLGPITMKTIRPDGDSTANFTTSTPSANHYENVDDAVVDDDTSYVESSTSGHRELYNYAAVSGLDSIKGLALNLVANDGGNDEAFKHLISSNGTEESSSNNNINSSNYGTFLYASDSDPDTSSSWNTSAVNAAKFGSELP